MGDDFHAFDRLYVSRDLFVNPFFAKTQGFFRKEAQSS